MESEMNYLKTIPLDKRTKKHWIALVYQALSSRDLEGWNYVHQAGYSSIGGKKIVWESVNYQNLLRAVRSEIKSGFRPISQARWWLDHRLSCHKRGIRISLETAINYK